MNYVLDKPGWVAETSDFNAIWWLLCSLKFSSRFSLYFKSQASHHVFSKLFAQFSKMENDDVSISNSYLLKTLIHIHKLVIWLITLISMAIGCVVHHQ